MGMNLENTDIARTMRGVGLIVLASIIAFAICKQKTECKSENITHKSRRIIICPALKSAVIYL